MLPAMKVSALVDLLDRLYPFALAEEWDNVGLIAGDSKAEVNRAPQADPVAFAPSPLPALASLRALLAESAIDLPHELPPMAAGIFGYMGYDTVRLIEHLPDEPKIIRELRRVLKRGGTLVLGTPDYSRLTWVVLEWIYGRVLPDAYAEEHITHFTQDSLARRLAAEGFEVLDCQYVFGGEMIFKARKL